MTIGKWRRSSLQDVRVRRDVGVGCDHFVVTAYIKLKLKVTGQWDMRRSHYDVDNLKDSHKKRFVLHLKNKFHVLIDQDVAVRNADDKETAKNA